MAFNGLGWGWSRETSAVVLVLLLAACGGGGGGGVVEPPSSGGGNTPPPVKFPNLQPPAAPAGEVVVADRIDGVLNSSADPLDAGGRKAGITVELREVLADGSLGAVRGTGVTAADGSFQIGMPAGASTSDGKWLLSANASPTPLRAYVHSGLLRVDVGSEALARAFEQKLGKRVRWPSGSMGAWKSISRSVGLVADCKAVEWPAASVAQAVDKLVSTLSKDKAMDRALTAMATTGALPANGLGDIGAFLQLSDQYVGKFMPAGGTAFVAKYRSFETPAADGAWIFDQQTYLKTNGSWTVQTTGLYERRVTAGMFFAKLPPSQDTVLNSVWSAIGHVAQTSLPLQPGNRQIDARRVENTGVTFTGGTTEDPVSVSSTEVVSNIESVTVDGVGLRAVRTGQDLEIGFPNKDGSVLRLLIRTTAWFSPGLGMVKQTSRTYLDGVLDPGSAANDLQLQAAYSGGLVWPARTSIVSSKLGLSHTQFTCALAIPGTRRIASTVAGPNLNGSPTLGIALWDADSLKQIGTTKFFQGYKGNFGDKSCPALIGPSNALLVLEHKSFRDTVTDLQTASASSDVVHVLSSEDLSELATYRPTPVSNKNNPQLFNRPQIYFAMPAPDASGNFALVYGEDQLMGHLVQILGPQYASAVGDLGYSTIGAVDWKNGLIYSYYGGDSKYSTQFSSAGVNLSSTRSMPKTFSSQDIWYSSPNSVYFWIGTSVNPFTFAEGPRLPIMGPGYANLASACSRGFGAVVCIDIANDRLVRYDPDTWVETASVSLASDLRALLANQQRLPNAGFNFVLGLSASNVIIENSEYRVGSWE